MDSIWLNEKVNGKYNRLDKNIETKVCIIGGGITGISIAYQLTKNNIEFVLLEKNNIVSKATPRTTAKITSQHGLMYNYLVNSYGTKFAKDYFYANEEAITDIKNIIEKENIECDFKKENSYVLTNDDSHVINIQKEVEAANKITSNVAEFVTNEKLPLEYKCGIKLKNQACFNPIKYINGLLKVINKDSIYENSGVYKISKSGKKYIVYTNNGVVKCDFVVIATKYPIKDIPGFYFLKMYQETSYVIAIKPNDEKRFEGIYISEDTPKISLRWCKYNGEDVLLVGGNNNKTGENIPLKEKYNELEKIAIKIYPNCEVIYKWNTEDTISLDKIAYIGKFSCFCKNMFVATGYNKWGMTTSNIASRIIIDKILGKKNKYEHIYSSTRLNPIKNYKEMLNMLKTSINSLFINKLKVKNVNKVKLNNGTIYKENGNIIGIYIDENGKVYKIKPVCKHLGCLLKFNELDKTWDCPCHGSRYDYKGNVIYGPSSKNLDKY